MTTPFGLGVLQYKGSFRVPQGMLGNSTFSWAQGAAGYCVAHDSLYLVGHTDKQMVAEISLPDPVVGPINTMKTAQLMQGFADVTEGRVPLTPQTGGVARGQIGGLLPEDEVLIWSTYAYYPAGFTQTAGFGKGSLNLQLLQAEGVFGMGAGVPPIRALAGPMCRIPDDYQALTKCTHLCGLSGVNITETSSTGLSFSGFHLGQLGSYSCPVKLGAYYDPAHPLGGKQMPADSLWAWVCTQTGLAFLSDGTHASIFVFGRHGDGITWYGHATGSAATNGDGVPGPIDYGAGPDTHYPAKGNHSDKYSSYCWEFDPADWLKVLQGKLLPWQIKPVARGLIPGIPQSGFGWTGGVGQDIAGRRLFVVDCMSDGAGVNGFHGPLVHVLGY